MTLTVSKIEVGGVSTVNRIRPCDVCKQYTKSDTSPLVDLHLWLDSPRGATTYGCVLSIHVACLQSFIVRAETMIRPKGGAA
jgi:hypothetical protein